MEKLWLVQIQRELKEFGELRSGELKELVLHFFS